VRTTPTKPTKPTKTKPTRTKAKAAKAKAAKAARRSARLKVKLSAHRLDVSTRSPAPLQATVAALPSGRIITAAALRATTALKLPTGRYRVCITQPTVDGWLGARSCVAGVRPATVHAHVVSAVSAFAAPATAFELAGPR
jgi:hypothetical protein